MFTPADSRELYLPGSRIGVILVHGLTGTPFEMKHIAKRLNQYGFSVYCPLLAGHCEDEAHLMTTTYKDWLKSAEDGYDRFHEATDVIFAGGLCFGAEIAAHLSYAKKDRGGIRGLSLFSAGLKWDGWAHPFYTKWLSWLLEIPGICTDKRRFSETFPFGIKNEKLRNIVEAQMKNGESEEAGTIGCPAKSLREGFRLLRDFKKHMKEIDSPTVFIHAKDDDVVSPKNAKKMQKLLAVPSKLLLLENSYHMVTIDDDRKLVADASAAHFGHLLNENELSELASKAEAKLPDYNAIWVNKE